MQAIGAHAEEPTAPINIRVTPRAEEVVLQLIPYTSAMRGIQGHEQMACMINGVIHDRHLILRGAAPLHQPVLTKQGVLVGIQYKEEMLARTLHAWITQRLASSTTALRQVDHRPMTAGFIANCLHTLIGNGTGKTKEGPTGQHTNRPPSEQTGERDRSGQDKYDDNDTPAT